MYICITLIDGRRPPSIRSYKVIYPTCARSESAVLVVAANLYFPKNKVASVATRVFHDCMKQNNSRRN